MKKIHFFQIVVIAFWISNLFAGGIQDKLGFGFNVNSQKLYGDTQTGAFVFGGNPFVLRYDFKPYAYLETDIGFSKLSTKISGVNLDTDMINLGVKVGYRFLHTKRINPLFYVGIGVFNFRLGNSPRFWDGYGAVGVGTEMFVNNSLGLNFTGDFRYTSGTDFDGGGNSWRKDGFLNIAFGLNYYLGGRTRKMPKPVFVESVSEQDLAVAEVATENALFEDNSETFDISSILDLFKSKSVEEKKPDQVVVAVADEDTTTSLITDEDVTTSLTEEESEYYTVQAGDWLYKIARNLYGDAMKYKIIFELNRDIIEDPNLIFPGQRLRIPSTKDITRYHTVQPGQSLSQIAEKYFGDAMKYNIFFALNRDIIADPNLIYPRQRLLLPKN